MRQLFLFQSVADNEIVVGEYGVDAHFAVSAGLLYLVGVEHVAENAVLMSLVNHFLIEVGLEQLDLLRTECDSPAR